MEQDYDIGYVLLLRFSNAHTVYFLDLLKGSTLRRNNKIVLRIGCVENLVSWYLVSIVIGMTF